MAMAFNQSGLHRSHFCTRGAFVLGSFQLDPKPRVVEAGRESLSPLVGQGHLRTR